MVVRRIARPMFASWFVSEGVHALRQPDSHAEQAREVIRAVQHRVPEGRLGPLEQYREPTHPQLVRLVRAHGAATAAAGLALAAGRAPRLAALALAGLTLPLAVAALVTPTPHDQHAREERRSRVATRVAFVGGALIVAADREGRPGLAWRLDRARTTGARQARLGLRDAQVGAERAAHRVTRSL